MQEAPHYVREYVEVTVDFTPEGVMVPRFLTWEDGHRYEIDRIRGVQAAPALKAGGQGDRYTVMIGGKERFLFFEHNADYGDRKIGKWFVEKKII